MSVSGVCRRDVNQCSDTDREVHTALNKSLERSGEKRAGSHVAPNGRGFTETKKAQGMGVEHLAKKVGAEALAKKAIEKGAVHKAAELAEKAGKDALGRALSLAGWIKTGVEITTYVHKATVETARELGQEQHEGNLRDAQNVAILKMAAPKLPADYVNREIETRSRSSDYAKKIETELQARSAGAYLKLLKQVQHSAQAGVDRAKQLGVNSDSKLAETLKKDAEFAKAYETNTAFRHGVRSTFK